MTVFDDEWFDAFCHGDNHAWDLFRESQLCQDIHKRAKWMARNLREMGCLRQETDEDFLWEALTAVWQESVDYRTKNRDVPSRGFFFKVAVCAMIGLWRSSKGTAQGLRQAHETRDESDKPASAIEKHAVYDDWPAIMSEIEVLDLIERAKLKPEQKEVLLLRLNHLTFVEISEKLGVPKSTVRARFLAALPILFEAMGGVKHD